MLVPLEPGGNGGVEVRGAGWDTRHAAILPVPATGITGQVGPDRPRPVRPATGRASARVDGPIAALTTTMPTDTHDALWLDR